MSAPTDFERKFSQLLQEGKKDEAKAHLLSGSTSKNKETGVVTYTDLEGLTRMSRSRAIVLLEGQTSQIEQEAMAPKYLRMTSPQLLQVLTEQVDSYKTKGQASKTAGRRRRAAPRGINGMAKAAPPPDTDEEEEDEVEEEEESVDVEVEEETQEEVEEATEENTDSDEEDPDTETEKEEKVAEPKPKKKKRKGRPKGAKDKKPRKRRGISAKQSDQDEDQDEDTAEDEQDAAQPPEEEEATPTPTPKRKRRQKATQKAETPEPPPPAEESGSSNRKGVYTKHLADILDRIEKIDINVNALGTQVGKFKGQELNITQELADQEKYMRALAKNQQVIYEQLGFMVSAIQVLASQVAEFTPDQFHEAVINYMDEESEKAKNLLPNTVSDDKDEEDAAESGGKS